jgi:D-alanine-D-alanine ligase
LGEDGCLQGLLEIMGLPYVGSGPRASALAAHKPSAKVLFQAAGLPLARGVLVERSEGASDAARRVARELGLSVVLKPASGGSAIGVVRLPAAGVSDLERGLERVFELDDVLVECFHSGREVTCGVLETDAGTAALPPTLIEAQASDWYDFRSRYQAGGSTHTCPAPLGDEIVAEVQSIAVAAHRALGARDLSRVDFVVEPSGAVLLLEVNTLPGMTQTSNFPEAAAVSGVPFPELCAMLCRRAWRRPRRVTPTVMNMPVPVLSGPRS